MLLWNACLTAVELRSFFLEFLLQWCLKMKRITFVASDILHIRVVRIIVVLPDFSAYFCCYCSSVSWVYVIVADM